MINAVRQEVAAIADFVVVKVGTRVLTHPDGSLDLNQVRAIAGQLVQLADQDRRVVLVSSGAVGAGMGRLGLKQRPTDLAQLQAAAAVGQSLLIEAYNQVFQTHGRSAAQVLLTAEDLNDRDRYLNVRNTLLALFKFGAMPIVNENDTVRVDELQRSVGDNDRLAAVVTNLLRAPLLVLLSDVEGLYDGDPSLPESKVISTVTDIDDEILSLAGVRSQEGLALSTGGMASKLEAARHATMAGENVVVANGRRPNVLIDLLEGKEIGTMFTAHGASVSSRKRWIGWTAQPSGELVLDSGARTAIEDRGRSLLAVGIRQVAGNFGKGDVVSLVDDTGQEWARGLTNYTSEDLRQIVGLPSEEIADRLSHRPYKAVVHRDNLVLTT